MVRPRQRDLQEIYPGRAAGTVRGMSVVNDGDGLVGVEAHGGKLDPSAGIRMALVEGLPAILALNPEEIGQVGGGSKGCYRYRVTPDRGWSTIA